MSVIKLNLNKKTGKIKPLHGGGQPPLVGISDEHFHYLTEAGIPYSRLHDVGGAYGANRFVDIPNIFRDFDADENDPASYDFTFTDILMSALVKAGVKPYYRLGITIETYANIKAYRTAPPADFHKWARVCEHIIMHYNEGWANGFFYGVEYWEIWGEPDNRFDGKAPLWGGTDKEYFELYEITAKHLKARFPDIKIGGYSCSGLYGIIPEDIRVFNTASKEELDGLLKFFHDFIDHVKKTSSPLDFFSWHSYSGVEGTAVMQKYIRKHLDENGFTNTESHLNEYNPDAEHENTAFHSAAVASLLLAMQNEGVDLMCIYDMRWFGKRYAPLFNYKTDNPSGTYYSLAAFNELYKLEDSVALDCDEEGVYAVCASSGGQSALMIANVSGRSVELQIEGADLENAKYLIINETRHLAWTPKPQKIENETVLLISW